MAAGAGSYLSIGAFSRMVGVTPELLRAWERRYSIPKPARTAKGQRLYSAADAELVRAMRRALAEGRPAAEAARLAAATPAAVASEPPSRELERLRRRLSEAVERLDDTAAQTALDRLFGVYSIDAALSEVILPFVREVGERWACDELGVGHEHFATNLIQGRLLSLARNWGRGHGPMALLACPAGEHHTIGLLAFGLTLRMHGWRITYLGADTPVDAIAHVADAVDPARIVVTSLRSDIYETAVEGLGRLAARHPLALAGAGATAELATRVGADLLAGGPVTEAAGLDWPTGSA
jgi:MerR family transcriptional regulator, light-induced transcriptional regulator